MCTSSKGFWSLVNNTRGKSTTKSCSLVISLFENVTEAANSVNAISGQFYIYVTSDIFPRFSNAVNQHVSVCNDHMVYN